MKLTKTIVATWGLFSLLLAGCSDEGTLPPLDNRRIPVVRQLTAQDDVFEANPIFSPDGTWILFESDAAGNRDIWRLPAGGGTAEQLTTDTAFDTSPFWSPDGHQIVFESDRGGFKHIFTLDLLTPGAAPVAVTSGNWDYGSPAWSPDGTRIVYESNRAKNGGSDLWVSPATGGEALRVTATSADVYHASADWSPDGTEVVFESNREGSTALYVMSALGGVTRRITQTNGYQGHPAWSPGGSQIAFESLASGTMEIYVIAPTGGDAFRVTSAGGYWPRWAPDGSAIVYGVYGDLEPNIWTVEVDW